MTDAKMIEKRGIIAAMCLAFCFQARIYTQNALAGMAEAYPQLSLTRIQNTLGWASTAAIVGSLIAGPLAMYIMSKKGVGVLGLILSSFGILPGFVPDGKMFGFIMFCRIMMGVGCGLITAAGPGIIGDYSEGSRRNKLVGYQQAVVNIGGLGATLFGGMIAAIHWKYCNFIYFVCLIMAIAVYFLIPGSLFITKEEREANKLQKAQQKADKAAGGGLQIKPRFFVAIAAGFCFMLFFEGYGENLVFLVQERGFSPAVAGTIGTALTITGIFAGALLGHVAKFTKHITVGLGYIFAGLGFFVLAASSSIPIGVIGSCLCGIGLRFAIGQETFLAIESVGPKAYVFAAGMVSIASHFAQTLTAYILNPLAGNFVKDKSLQFATTFHVMGVAMFILGVVFMILITIAFRGKAAVPRDASAAQE